MYAQRKQDTKKTIKKKTRCVQILLEILAAIVWLELLLRKPWMTNACRVGIMTLLTYH